jgi:succinate dehydrogenase/fumarate reductase flavoprotein subunit
METKSKHYPFSTRDCSKFMEISVQSYINDRQRKGQDEAVWMRLTDIDKQLSLLPAEHNLRRMWPISKSYLTSIGIDFDRRFRVACFGHAMSGGLRIDPFGRTGVEGLYAAGETAGGPHGADRLGGNMFSTTQVFGKRAALHAAQYGRKRGDVIERQIVPIKKTAAESNASGASGPALRLKLQRLASRSLLIVREDDHLAEFIHETEKMAPDLDRLSPNTPNPLRTKYELRNLILTGQAVAMAARMRGESRGSHYRKDYPEPDDKWSGKILVSSMNDAHELICRELPSHNGPTSFT